MSGIERVRRFLLVSGFSVGLLGMWVLCSGPADAGVPADQVPTFQLRARVVSVGGQPPAGQSFNVSFPYYSNYINAQSQQATAAGSNWSGWLIFDRPQV